MLCCAKLLQSCSTLCRPVDCSPPGSSVHGILQARILEWVAMPSSRGSFLPRDQTCGSCIASGFFTAETSGKPTQNRISSLEIKNSITCQQLYKQKIRWLVNLFLWLFITSLGCGQDGRVGRPLSPTPLTAHQNHYYLQRNSLWEWPKDEQKTFHSWRQKEGAATRPTGVAKARHPPEQQTPQRP